MADHNRPRAISVRHLIDLRRRIEECGISPPPRELDLEIFQVMHDFPTRLTGDDAVTKYGHGGFKLWGRQWAYEVAEQGIVGRYPDGNFYSFSKKVEPPELTVVPFFLTCAEDAFFWLYEIGSFDRLVNVELLDFENPKWRALLTVAGDVMAAGEAGEIGGAIVLAMLDDLIRNGSSSARIDLVD